MKRLLSTIVFFAFIIALHAQTESSGLKMISEYTENEELSDILHFEGIDYFKLKFVGGEELRNKSYSIRAKEFKNGDLVSDSIIIDTKTTMMKMFETVNDTILSFSVIAKKTTEGRLKVMFNFPAFSTGKEFETIDTKDKYVLKNIADDSGLSTNYNESFYLLAYILPYDVGNGLKSYCEVSRNGDDLENWGKRFGLAHYILFEMKIYD